MSYGTILFSAILAVIASNIFNDGMVSYVISIIVCGIGPILILLKLKEWGHITIAG